MLKIKNWQFLKNVKHFVSSKKGSTFALSKGKRHNIINNIRTLQGIGQLLQEL